MRGLTGGALRNLLVLCMCGVCLLTARANAGKLVIVGGALGADTGDVYRAFIQALPPSADRIAIVPLASSSPSKSAGSFRDTLIDYGVAPEKIRILPLAVEDDRSTDVDESRWLGNAGDTRLASSLQDIGGFWFVGGDQMRIISALMPEPDKPSEVLKAIYERLQEGAVIGGTSAGAAIMSEPMIAAGDSFSALVLPPAQGYSGTESQELGKLYLHHGLGFFPYGIIDQHFDRKARLGRLAKALHDGQRKRGIGIDENTGIVVDLNQHSLTVVGSGNVTLLNADTAEFKPSPFSARSIGLSLLSAGDQFDLQGWRPLRLAGTPTVGSEYASEAPHQGAGLAMANSRLNHLLGYQLLDNSGTRELRRYSFDESGRGLLYRFRQTDNSQGFWAVASGSIDRYSIDRVLLDIRSVAITIDDKPELVGRRDE